MAGGIKGITVKIGGDTTELGRSLSDATKKSTALQRELKGVNTLLKMDPGNITLLQQRSQLLTQTFEETRNKLQSLKEVLAKVETGEIEMTEEEFRNLQREIASTEGKLKDLTAETSNFGSVASQQIGLAGEKLKEVGQGIENFGQKLAPLSAASGAALSGSIYMASEFADAMAMVNTIADTNTVSLTDLSNQVMDLSNETGIAATEIAEATYNAISASVDTADAVAFVGSATELARAGFTDVGKSIDVLTTICNAYGDQAGTVDEISNRLIMTQNLGKVTVDQLASSMGKAIPTAKSVNVGMDELCASYAVMTSNGIQCAETTTYLNSMMNELGKQGSTASEAFAKGTEHIKEGGLSMAEAMEMGWSLTDVLSILDEQASESGTSIKNMFGSAEAGTAAATLWDNAQKLNETVEMMGGSAGATQTALEKLETPSHKAQVAINQLKNSATLFGQTILAALAPAIEAVSDGIAKATEWFNNLSPSIQKTIGIVLAVVAALSPVLVVIGKLTQAFGTMMTWAPKISGFFNKLKIGAAGISAPMVAIVAVIGVLVAAFKHLWDTNEEFRAAIVAIWEGVKSKFEEFGNAIKSRLDGISIDFSGVVETLKAVWDGFCQILAPLFTGAFETISTVIGTVLDVIIGIVDVFIALFSGNWQQAWDGVLSILSSIWDGILSVFETAFNTMVEVGTVILGFFGATWTDVWNGISSFFTTVWNGIVGFITGVWNGMKNLATSTWNGITTAISNAITSARNTVQTIVNAIKSAISTAWNTIKSTTSSVFNSITSAISNALTNARNSVSTICKNIFNTMKDAFVNVGSTFSNIGKNVIQGIINGIGSMVSSLYNSIHNALSGLVSRAKSALGIHSPSRVFADQVGEQIPAGVAVGVDEGTDEAEKAIEKMANKLGSQEIDINGATINRRLNATFGADMTGDRASIAMLQKIYDKLDALKIYLDSGELVGGIINDVDTALGNKYTKTARGWG